MIMKKLAMTFITILFVASLTTSAFAFGPGWQERGRYDNHGWKYTGRYDNHGGYDSVHYRYNNYDRHVYPQPHRYYAPVYAPRPVVFVPPLPLPGINILFPDVNIRIR